MRSRLVITALAVLLFAGAVSAQTTDCNNPHYFKPDAGSTDIFLSASTTYWFAFVGLQGHSYSFEYFAAFANTGAQDNAVLLYAPADTPCTTPGTTTLTVNADTFADPYMSNVGFTGRRRSFVAPASGVYKFSIAQGASGQTSTFRVVDTTLYNPRWSTYSGFITQYGFQNTTNEDLSVTVTVTKVLPAGAPITLGPFTVPANSEVFKVVGASSGDIVAGANQAGFAVAAYNGAPGVLKADAYFINPSATVIVPNSFEPRDSKH